MTTHDETEIAARDVLARMSAKWPLAIMHTLAEAKEAVRYTRILEALDGITQKVLTNSLRALERDGFVHRHVFAQVPPRVEYRLTLLGWELLEQVDPVVIWTRSKVAEIQIAQRQFDNASGGNGQ